jgi:competence protein ComEC
VAWALSQPDGKLHISFLDVGQGDATLIQTPGGRYILIDGGLYPSVLNDHLGREIPFWDRSVDLVIATHPDEDHVAGLPGVFDRFGVGQLITNGQPAQEESYQALMDIATKHAVPIHQAKAGEIIELGDGVRLEILNPPSPQSLIPSLTTISPSPYAWSMANSLCCSPALPVRRPSARCWPQATLY